MPARKLKPVEAGDGSYAGMVLEAFDSLEEGLPMFSEIEPPPPETKTNYKKSDNSSHLKLV